MVTYNGKKILMGNIINRQPASRATENNSGSLVPYNASNWPLFGSDGSMVEDAMLQSNHCITGCEQMFVHPLELVPKGVRDVSKNYYFGAMDVRFSYENITNIDQTYNGALPGQIFDRQYVLLNTAITQHIDGELLKTIYTFTIQAEENITIGTVALYKQIFVNENTVQEVLIAWNNLGYKEVVKRKETQIFTLEIQL